MTHPKRCRTNNVKQTDELDGEVVEDGLASPESLEKAQQQHVTLTRRPVDPTQLTPKQIERVLKNRQAAQASRERKRAYVTELEESRDRLRMEAQELRQRVVILERDKSKLMNEVDTLRAEFDELRRLLIKRDSTKVHDKASDDDKGFFRNVSTQENNDRTNRTKYDDPNLLVDHTVQKIMDKSFRTNNRSAAQPANFQWNATSSPSTPRGHLLGSGRLSSMPLPNRIRRSLISSLNPSVHVRHLPCRSIMSKKPLLMAFPAPMTRSLLRPRLSSSLKITKVLSKPQRTSSGSITMTDKEQIHSLTWQQRMTITDLMTSLISKYHSTFSRHN